MSPYLWLATAETPRDIDSYPGRFVTRCSLRLRSLPFLRPFEQRALEWEWIDFEEAEIRIPRTSMKGARTYHVVPLSIQALAIFKELHALTGHGRYVSPPSSDPSKNDQLEHDYQGVAHDGLYRRTRSVSSRSSMVS
jgi:integrase